MALKGRMSRSFYNVGVLALDLSLFFYLSVPSTAGNVFSRQPFPANGHTVAAPSEPAVLRNVHIDNLFSLPVVQQPGGKPNYVSKKAGEVTLFTSAAEIGNVGLLAHNYLSGKSFFRLTVGQEVHLDYEDGTREVYVVTEILRYEALEPKSPFSSFRNLGNPHEILSAQQMFQRAYGGNRHITFQTCIAKFGNASWGRLFVVAQPKTETLGYVP